MKELYIRPLTEPAQISGRLVFLTESDNVTSDPEGFGNEYNQW